MDDQFQPYIKPDQIIPEVTFRAIILGIILTVVFGAANAYVGLKVGMTICASIPAAVVSMAILRVVLRSGTVLENNIVQTIGSSGESLAAGVIFTIPALIFLGAEPKIIEIFIIAALGGCLGVFFMIPLRRFLIVKEHRTLPYPEGTACAEILKAGEHGGRKALTVLVGAVIGGVYKFLMQGLGLWREVAMQDITLYKRADASVKTSLGADVTPVLLGVGYIIGPRIAALMFAGAVLGWLVLIPLIKQIGLGLVEPVLPAGLPISQLSPIDIWSNYIRYIGAGAVALGGVVSLLKAFPVIVQSVKLGVVEMVKKRVAGAREELRTERDIPMKYVIAFSALIVLVIWIYLEVFSVRDLIDTGQPFSVIFSGMLGAGGKNLVAAGIIVVFGFFFVTVAARIVGLVGSSSSPVSGMTLTTLIATSLIFVWMGWTGQAGMIAALVVGAVVCIAVCMAGDISQDLKTGYLLGATPRKQQLTEFIGVLASAAFIGWVVLLLNKTYGLGPGTPLEAPQATLMAMVVKGVIGGNLPWLFVIVGIFIGLAVELLGVSSLPFAIGLYLPFKLSAPIMLGGFIAWLVARTTRSDERKERQEKGILFSSGLVAGDALVGIIIAGLASLALTDKIRLREKIVDTGPENLLAFGIFIALAVILFGVIKSGGSK